MVNLITRGDDDFLHGGLQSIGQQGYKELMQSALAVGCQARDHILHYVVAGTRTSTGVRHMSDIFSYLV